MVRNCIKAIGLYKKHIKSERFKNYFELYIKHIYIFTIQFTKFVLRQKYTFLCRMTFKIQNGVLIKIILLTIIVIK